MGKLTITRRGKYVLGIAAVLGLAAIAGLAGTSELHASLPACATETSHDCHWDSTREGNGVGQSFDDINGVVTPTGPDYTVAPCAAWADTRAPKLPAYTVRDKCFAPDGSILSAP